MIRSLLKEMVRWKHRKTLPEKQRHDDVFLVSYPKSGNTWVSFLIANGICKHLSLPMEVNFFNIHSFVPDIHAGGNISERLRFAPFPRIIKSHSGYNPYYNRVILLVRDPRDVVLSYWYFQRGLGEFSGTLDEFVRHRKWGVSAWVDHTESWLKRPRPFQRVQLFRYEDFKEDPAREISRLFRYLGFRLGNELIEEAVDNSSLEAMKKLESETMSYGKAVQKEFRAVRKGTTGGGNEELSQASLELIRKKAGHLMDRLNYSF